MRKISAINFAKQVLQKTRLLSPVSHLLNYVHPSFDGLHLDNLKAITDAIQAAPSGDYYEFGVYNGFSLWFATEVAYALKKDIKFYGFDSFDGLPCPEGLDCQYSDELGVPWMRGSLSAGIKLVEQNLVRHKAPMDKIFLVKGFYKKVLNGELIRKYKMGKASVIMVDCDMYSSTKEVLEFIKPLIQIGTIILFDDWRLTDDAAGEQKAFAEWDADVETEAFSDFGIGKGFRIRKAN